MAIGLSRLFSVRLPLNFNSPYKSRNIAEFWRRWHMTLSRFLRDYLYIPLGGNRHGSLRRQINLMITMVLGGLWHGAGWNFVVWGALHGSFLVANQVWQELNRRIAIKLPFRLGRSLGVALTFICVVFAWVYFRSPDLATANRVMTGMLGGWGSVLPEPVVSRLGPLKPLLAALGIGTYLGGGANFVETWCWIGIGFLVAFFAPNTQEIMRYFDPALRDEGRSQLAPALRLAWVPTRLNAMITGMLFALGVLALSRPTEFLYFQF
jgi:hypothetical protein